MFNTLADVPQPIAAYYEEVETDGVTTVQLKPWGEVRSWGEVELVIELGKPEAVVDKFIALAEQGDRKQFHDDYLEYLAECEEVAEHNAGTYLDDDGDEVPNEPRTAPDEPVLDVKDSTGYRLAAFKKAREKAVSEITVEVEGMIFDGDEISQDRMTRAIVGMEAAALPSMEWRLHDNSTATVTRDQLAHALSLAGTAQSAIWFPTVG